MITRGYPLYPNSREQRSGGRQLWSGDPVEVPLGCLSSECVDCRALENVFFFDRAEKGQFGKANAG
jgi:hypothetical protein